MRSYRFVLGAMAALTLGSSLPGCFWREREPENRRVAREREWERDHEGHAYRRERWKDEDVYRREDGRWYARRADAWVVVGDVRIGP